VVVVSGAPPPRSGDYGLSLKDVPATKLGTIAIKEAIARAKVDPSERRPMSSWAVSSTARRATCTLSRVAAVDAGVPVGTPCLTVNRLCGSGLQGDRLGRAAHHARRHRHRRRRRRREHEPRRVLPPVRALGASAWADAAVVDAMTAALHDPSATATWASPPRTSPRSRLHARAAGRVFHPVAQEGRGCHGSRLLQVTNRAIELKTRKGVEQFVSDEHVRKDANVADLSRLKTVFKKDGTVTAGNASGINDAGAAIVLLLLLLQKK